MLEYTNTKTDNIVTREAPKDEFIPYIGLKHRYIQDFVKKIIL